MKITDFTVKITQLEAGTESLSIAQVAEVLRIINKQLWGIPYILIKLKRKK